MTQASEGPRSPAGEGPAVGGPAPHPGADPGLSLGDTVAALPGSLGEPSERAGGAGGERAPSEPKKPVDPPSRAPSLTETLALASAQLDASIGPEPNADGPATAPRTGGLSLGRYELGPVFARGGLGAVRQAVDTTLARPVAIKESLELGARADARLRREALITASLEHPGIVPIYDLGTHRDGAAFFVMRLVHGRPLSQAIAAVESPKDRLALLPHVVAAAQAIAFAHSRGIIHRDLKPANVLLGSFGETVVIDWGVAKALDLADETSSLGPAPTTARAAATDATGDDQIVGTLAYMSPEQARGEPLDARADVYALGAMLWAVLCGTPPYTARSLPLLYEAVITGARPRLAELEPELPPALVAIVETAMATDPQARYPSAEALAADLQRFSAGQLVSAHRYSSLDLLRIWARRNAAALAVGVIALVGLCGLGAAAWRGVQRERDLALLARDDAERAKERSLAARATAQDLLRAATLDTAAHGLAATALDALLELAAADPDDLAVRLALADGLASVEAVATIIPGPGAPPDRVLVDATGRVVAAYDRGLDRLAVWSTDTGALLGTIGGLQLDATDTIKLTATGGHVVTERCPTELPKTRCELRVHALGSSAPKFSVELERDDLAASLIAASADGAWIAYSDATRLGHEGVVRLAVASGLSQSLEPCGGESILDFDLDRRGALHVWCFDGSLVRVDAGDPPRRSTVAGAVEAVAVSVAGDYVGWAERDGRGSLGVRLVETDGRRAELSSPPLDDAACAAGFAATELTIGGEPGAPLVFVMTCDRAAWWRPPAPAWQSTPLAALEPGQLRYLIPQLSFAAGAGRVAWSEREGWLALSPEASGPIRLQSTETALRAGLAQASGLHLRGPLLVIPSEAPDTGLILDGRDGAQIGLSLGRPRAASGGKLVSTGPDGSLLIVREPLAVRTTTLGELRRDPDAELAKLGVFARERATGRRSQAARGDTAVSIVDDGLLVLHGPSGQVERLGRDEAVIEVALAPARDRIAALGADRAFVWQRAGAGWVLEVELALGGPAERIVEIDGAGTVWLRGPNEPGGVLELGPKPALRAVEGLGPGGPIAGCSERPAVVAGLGPGQVARLAQDGRIEARAELSGVGRLDVVAVDEGCTAALVRDPDDRRSRAWIVDLEGGDVELLERAFGAQGPEAWFRAELPARSCLRARAYGLRCVPGLPDVVVGFQPGTDRVERWWVWAGGVPVGRYPGPAIPPSPRDELALDGGLLLRPAEGPLRSVALAPVQTDPATVTHQLDARLPWRRAGADAPPIGSGQAPPVRLSPGR